MLLGRRPTAAQTLPSARASDEVGGDAALMRLRRARGRVGTVRSLAFEAAEADFLAASVAPVPRILRPPRVLLSTADGTHSMCLLRDREARLEFVLAGLPAGPRLRNQEGCAICLEQFQTGDRVQLMTSCRHVFHAACIDGFLRSHAPDCLVTDCVSCPLCRGPLLAASLSEIPRRERTFVTNLDAGWLHTGTANSTMDDEQKANTLDSTDPGQVVETKVEMRGQKGPLTRAGTVPVGGVECQKLALFTRSATAPLDALKID